MTANWLELRGVVEAQIKEFQELATHWRQQHRQLRHSQTELHQAARGSVNKQFALARSQLDSVVPTYDQSAQQMDLAAQDCRDWLARVDPDNANGTTKGLPTPVLQNIPHGGKGAPNVEPPRQPITDVSRRRTRVFTVQGPTGLKDLINRVPELIACRLDGLRVGGHTVGRHDKTVTDQQLRDRALYGRDPMTGTGKDWEHGEDHLYGKHATAFVSDEPMVFAEMYGWYSAEGVSRRAVAEKNGADQFTVRISAESVYGRDFRTNIRGWSRIGSRNNPTGVEPTVFPDDTEICIVYRRSSTGSEWQPYTCYPDMAKKRTRT